MVHFTAQLIVQTLKEGSIIDKAVAYGLSIQYDKKCANLYRMTVDLTAPVTTIEDFGEYPLVDAINIIIYTSFSNIDFFPILFMYTAFLF